MVIELSAEQEAYVLDLAKHEGKTVEQVMLDTLQWLAATEQADRASILRGLEQADRGEFLEQAELDRRVANMLGR